MKYLYASVTLFSAGVICMLEAGSAFVPSREAMPKYIAILKNSANGKDRAEAADMIARRGKVNIKDVADAVEPLKKMAEKDTDLKARTAAIVALGSIAPDPAGTVPILTKALKEKNYDLRMAAVNSLANYGSEAKEALPALRELAKELNDKKNAKIITAAMQQISAKGKK